MSNGGKCREEKVQQEEEEDEKENERKGEGAREDITGRNTKGKGTKGGGRVYRMGEITITRNNKRKERRRSSRKGFA